MKRGSIIRASLLIVLGIIALFLRDSIPDSIRNPIACFGLAAPISGAGWLFVAWIRAPATGTKATLLQRLSYIWHEKPQWAVKLSTSISLLLLLASLFTCGMAINADPNDFMQDNNSFAQTPLWILTCLLIIMGLACFVAGASMYFRKRDSTKYGSAHFATLHEMQEAGLTNGTSQKEPNSLELGVYFLQRIGLTERQQESHVLLVAPSGKGKTSGIIIPALLNENGDRSLIINDVKGELIEKCAGALAENYLVKIFAPTRPQRSNSYNPLAHLKSVEDVEDLADTWIANTGTSQSDPFWDRASAALITAVILHVTEDMKVAPPFNVLADIFTGKTLDEIQQILSQSPSQVARRSTITFMNSVSNNPKLGGSILLELSSRFRLLNNPGIQAITSQDEFDFDTLVNVPSAWFLSIPASETKRIKPLSACFLMQMMKRLTQRAENSPGGRLPSSVIFYLDEFINAGRIMHFESHISLVRSAGIAFLLAVQDFGQLNREYGEDIANTIRANAATHIVFPGCGQVECQFYSDRIGDTTTFSRSTGYSVIGEGISLTLNDSETRRRLLNPDEIRTLPLGTLLVLHGNTPPLLVHNVPYYRRPDLTARVHLPFKYPAHAAPKTPPTPQQTASRTPDVIYAPPAGTYQQSQSQQAAMPGASSQSSPNDPFSLP